MKEINELRIYLHSQVELCSDNKDTTGMHLAECQLMNAHKVAAKLQGAIDLFKEIAE
jgi:hypothetical protein